MSTLSRPVPAHAAGATFVSDVMRHGVLSCSPETPLRIVAAMMSSNRVHAIVVVHDEGDGDITPWGVVSDLDLLESVRPPIIAPVAGDLAQTPAVMIAPDDPLIRAAQLMRENNTSHLIVVDRATAQPVGVVSTLDIVSAIAARRA